MCANYQAQSGGKMEVEDYGALVKSGGRKDLLCHFENVRDPNRKQIEVPPSVDWFAHQDIPKRVRGSPHESIHKDHWSHWNTDSPKLPAVSSQSTTEPPKKRESLKLPSIPSKKDDVDMRRLLSLDYQKEWLDIRKAKMLMERERLKATQTARMVKLEEHVMMTRKNLELDKRERMPRRTANSGAFKLPPL